MYGLTPSAKTEKFFMAFPETRLSMFKKDKPLRASKLFAFTPGTVILVPTRKTRMIKIVKRIFDRTCLTLRASFNNLKNIGHLS